MISRVLLALDEPSLQKVLKTRMTTSDVLVDVPRARNHLWKRINRETSDMVVVSHSYVPRPKIEMIRSLSEQPGSPALAVITDRNDPEERASLLAAGAEEVLYSGLQATSIIDVLSAILERRRDHAIQSMVPQGILNQPRLTDFVSNSPVMQDFMEMVQRTVRGSTSLLLQGETGVGKERLAMAIHGESPRSDGPFIAINCGALPESLLESELFGHEEGAFTGATRARRGCFEVAHHGTIFLDEIGEMPLHVQVRLLRVLQEHKVQRIGGERPITVDVRVMAATNRDLQADVQQKLFRSDLYYRLSVVTLTVPPLRERRADIHELLENYLLFLRPRVGREVLSITPEAVAALESYDWPGNVRELINVVERAMLLCASDQIDTVDLPDSIKRISDAAPRTPSESGHEAGEIALPGDWRDLPLAEVKRRVATDVERTYLATLLKETRGRIGTTAERAGITPRALHTKMKSLALRKEDFKP